MDGPGKRLIRDHFTFSLVHLIILMVSIGCTRTHYRRQADKQSYQILAEKTGDTRWNLPRLDITPDPRSRFFDPYDPDCPPLPPDDPTAHQYMHCAYGMHGWKHWHDFGETDQIENPNWSTILNGAESSDSEGDVPVISDVTIDNAVALGLIHSREYQEQLENVYLSALALTYQRYKFQLRPRGFLGEPGTDLFYQHQPDDQSNLALGPTHFGVSKLLPGGAQLIAEMANNTLWLFSGSNTEGTATSLGYSIVQPLLAGAGREIVMEKLTQSERNTLYEIRRFARFRKDYYVMVVTGRRAAPLPGSAGGSELAFLIRGERSPTVGFNLLLYLYQVARNQQENVKSLERRLLDVEAMLRDGTATSLDVTQVRSSLQNARAIYLFRSRRFEDELDRFKLQIGLPPDLELQIDDSLLEPFRFRSSELTRLEDRLRDLDVDISSLRKTPTLVGMQDFADELVALRKQLDENLQYTSGALRKMQDAFHVRRRQMVEDEIVELDELQAKYTQRFQNMRDGFAKERTMLSDISRQLITPDQNPKALEQLLEQLVRQRDTLMQGTRRLNALTTTAKAESVILPPVDSDLTPAKAVELALSNRLDLMNRRAFVMDARRRLEIAANRLEATLDIVAEGEVNTRPLLENNKPFDFRAKESAFRVGVAITTPLDRRRERNDFRAAQIAYQRARRNYMAAEDQVKLDARHELRRLHQEAKGFEVQRRALRLAAEELEQSLEIGPGKPAGSGSQQGLNIPRALENILEAQNLMIEGWMDYERARLTLFRDMGTMVINDGGVWPVADQQAGIDVTETLPTPPPDDLPIDVQTPMGSPHG